MIVALTIAAAILAAYVALSLVLWRFQERIVFQPPRWPLAESAEGMGRLSYSATDGNKLMAHVVGAAGPSRRTVLAFHGNAVVARWLIPWAREVARRFDACVVLAEYRGYDGLGGSPTYPGVALDARAALDATSSHANVESSRIILFGHSLGSAVATELAATTPIASLILQSPFSSARDMVARWPVVGFRSGWSLISRVHYDTIRNVRELDAPVFVAHGGRDLVVPARMGRAVFSAARNPGRLLLIPSAGHNDLPEVGGEVYWSWLAEALQEKDR
jgi:fermentation-respiration switch protein FrsA (DUF1100 family)